MDTVLFDLDGTLLPMDQEAFMNVYFHELTQKCAAYGVDPKATVDAVWAGTKAMIKNDGSKTNEDVFWHVFTRMLGDSVLALKPVLEKFYEEEFNNAQAVTKPNPLAAKLMGNLRARGFTLVLASNPVFPARAYRTRLGWIGLAPEDFDLVTSYEQFHYCKPNPQYYTEILQQIGKEAKQCLMVGNDLQEDGAAKTIGMDFHLITDHLLNATNEDYTGHRNSSFQAFFDTFTAPI